MVAVVAESAPVVIKDFVVRVERDQLKVLLAALAGEFPDLIEKPRGGNDRRAAVKLEAVDFIGIGAPAQFVPLLKERDVIPLDCQARRRAQPAEAAPNHDRFFAHEFTLYE